MDDCLTPIHPSNHPIRISSVPCVPFPPHCPTPQSERVSRRDAEGAEAAEGMRRHRGEWREVRVFLRPEGTPGLSRRRKPPDPERKGSQSRRDGRTRTGRVPEVLLLPPLTGLDPGWAAIRRLTPTAKSCRPIRGSASRRHWAVSRPGCLNFTPFPDSRPPFAASLTSGRSARAIRGSGRCRRWGTSRSSRRRRSCRW